MFIDLTSVTHITYLIVTLLISYFMYTRVIRMYYLKWFYESQNIPCCKEVVPILGNMVRCDRIFRTYDTNENPWYVMMQEDFKDDQPKMLQWFTGYEPTILISDPDVVYELYVTKNKYFDKHPRIS